MQISDTERNAFHGQQSLHSCVRHRAEPVGPCIRTGNADRQLTESVGSSNLHEARVHAWMQSFEIHKREEVDRLKVSIDGRWATDLCAHRQVRTQQFRYLIASALW